MSGLEPGDEARPIVRLHLTEAQESMHLVQVAADNARHVLQPVDEGVGLVVQRVRPLAQFHQHRVEQSEALWLPVADHLLRQRDEGARDTEQASGRRWGRGGRAEQAGFFAGHLPDYLGGRGADQSERPRRLAPALEIVGRREPDGADRPPFSRERRQRRSPPR